MKHQSITDTKVSQNVLGLDNADVASFVRRCVKERSLSRLMSDLNNDLLFGTEAEREDARRALHRLGFL